MMETNKLNAFLGTRLQNSKENETLWEWARDEQIEHDAGNTKYIAKLDKRVDDICK